LPPPQAHWNQERRRHTDPGRWRGNLFLFLAESFWPFVIGVFAYVLMMHDVWGAWVAVLLGVVSILQTAYNRFYRYR
jgi:hypothetical protein